MQLNHDRSLHGELIEEYFYIAFCKASWTFKVQFPTLAVWQKWLDKHWERLCSLHQTNQEDKEFADLVFDESRMVFTKMLILKKCKEVRELKDIPQARLVALINHIFTLEDILSTNDTDWDRSELLCWVSDGKLNLVHGYEGLSDVAVIYLQENLAALQAIVK